MKKLDNNLVVQHNELIVASYEMTVHEQNVLLACISQLDSRPEAKPITDQDEYTITVEQARDLFYTKGDQNNAYRDLESASRRLFDRKVELDIGDNKTLLTRFVQSIVFDPDVGAVTLQFATKILPYLTQLHNNYTQYRMGQVVELHSVHARRLFELVLMWIGQQQYSKEFDLDEFRDLMNVYRKYKQFGQLREKVITPAVNMVNEYTDLHVTVAYRKVRRSYRFIQLKFHRKEPVKPVENEKPQIDEPKPYKDPSKVKIPSWRKNGLSDAQITRLGYSYRLTPFLQANIDVIGRFNVQTLGKENKELYDDIKPFLQNSSTITYFKDIQKCLDIEKGSL